ncbi:MAG: ParA family protein [Anaerolineae bacterium]|nr:ParA family protein [Anaerolineae bacterium]
MIITIANQKGGVGKTTTAVTLAHGLAIQGKDTLLLDLDPQGQCASALGLVQEPGVFNLLVGVQTLANVTRTTGRPRLALIPGNKRTATAQVVLNAEEFKLDIIRQLLRPALPGGLNLVIIDTAPSVGRLQEAALFAADLVIIPTTVDYLATEGVVKVIHTVNALVKRQNWRGSVLGILPTFYDNVTRESQQTLDDLQRTFGAELILPPVHRATVLRECGAEGKTIWEKAASSRPAKEYADLVWRVADYLPT